MQTQFSRPFPRTAAQLFGIAAAAALALWGVLAYRQALWQVLTLLLGGAALAFIAAPLAKALERRLPRSAAALLALGALAGGVALLGWVVLPLMYRETVELLKALPQTLHQAAAWLEGLAGRVEARFPGLTFPQVRLPGAEGLMNAALSGAVSFIIGLADAAGKISLMLMLAWFFLCGRDTILLRLELLIPQKYRQSAVRMGRAVCRELQQYLRAQAAIALVISALAALGLTLAGVRSPLALGGIVGLLNVIPYFGPVIGGVPVVLSALSQSWQKALIALGVLLAVQQLDGSVVSPRIMGSVTGFSPAVVLVAIFAGARVGGIGGMLIALPLLMTFRTLFRVFVQRHENI